MLDDVATPSNPLVTLVEEEKFEETSLNMNVFQRSHKKKSSKRVVHTQSIVQHGIINCLLTHMP
jgi:hypothetical protein